jgi:hypothetical protein
MPAPTITTFVEVSESGVPETGFLSICPVAALAPVIDAFHKVFCRQLFSKTPAPVMPASCSMKCFLFISIGVFGPFFFEIMNKGLVVEFIGLQRLMRFHILRKIQHLLQSNLIYEPETGW